MLKDADLVSAPLVVNPDREHVIDFASSYFVEYTAVVFTYSQPTFLFIVALLI